MKFPSILKLSYIKKEGQIEALQEGVCSNEEYYK
jgi:hypothetical protein